MIDQRSPLNPNDVRPLYRQVESYIESLIHNGGLKPGELIPSHVHLAKVLGVNNLTIKRAVRELVFKRVLISLQGRGTFVAEGGIKRILWVTEIDLFSGTTSSYYCDLFRQVDEECQRNGLRLEPVWLPKGRPYDTALNANGGEAAILGYFFSACDLEHELLLHVRNSGRPFINVSVSYQGRPRCVLPNDPQAYRLSMEFLCKQGHKRATVFEISKEKTSRETHPAWPRLQVIAQPPGLSEVQIERNSYQITKLLLRQRELERAIYIMDDVIARGVSRALLELDVASRNKFRLLVQCSVQEILPLGLPVTHVTYDIVEQAKNAVKILLAQINGQESELQYYCDYQILPEETVAQLPGMKPIEQNPAIFQIYDVLK